MWAARAVIRFVTDFGDQAVLLPIALMVALGLLSSGWARGACAWLAATVAMSVTVLGLKIAFAACSGWVAATGIGSPSGHTAAATAIYGGLAALMLRRTVLPVALIPAVAIGAIIGVTRVALGEHTWSDVWLGFAIGLAAAAAARLLAGPPPARPWKRRASIVALALALVLHGSRLSAEPTIERLVVTYRLPTLFCSLP
jgi:membrane-associated phospholipid phosphatase